MIEDSVDVEVGAKHHRKRILLLAYDCSPYGGGELGMGWNRAIETAKYLDTWVLCRKQVYEDDIRQYITENDEILGLHFCFVSQSRYEKLLKRIPGLIYVAYNLWHRRAYRLAVELDKELRFDLAHQVNICGFREPGYLWKLGMPFIWGPVGGTQNYPWRFLTGAGIGGAVIEGFRSILNILQLRFTPRVRKAVRRAAILVVANSRGKSDFEKIHNVNPVLMLETGVRALADGVPERGKHQGPLRILWSGVFERRKALHLLIRALSMLPDTVNYKLRILGEGPLEKRWHRLAQITGVGHHCTWMGWLPREKAIEQATWADVFVFTSLRDTSGNVVLEALSFGTPVICLDHQGMRDIITDNCGIKIPVSTPREVIWLLRNAIICLSENRIILQTLSRGALKRAHEYLWSRNGERMAEIYKQILSSGH